MKFKLRKEVPLFEEPEWYWGVSYFNPQKRVMVCYIIPLNWLIWAIRELHFVLRFANATDALQREYDKGFEEGRKWEVVEIARKMSEHYKAPGGTPKNVEQVSDRNGGNGDVQG